MVRAILEGRKSQTRRVLKPQPTMAFCHAFRSDEWSKPGEYLVYGDAVPFPSKWGRYTRLEDGTLGVDEWNTPIRVGDRLWVREAWKSDVIYNDMPPRDMSGDEVVIYQADGFEETWGWPNYSAPGRPRASMHMPRWASRLTLTVTDVRVQRLQEISEKDAKAEGYENEIYASWASSWFRNLWDDLNEVRGYGWDTNPWVVAYTFETHHTNIDQLEAAA
tara:strand:- start:20829 stop:21485 length:657 start_codon:yes stop_codon:yes gene_type:complete